MDSLTAFKMSAMQDLYQLSTGFIKTYRIITEASADALYTYPKCEYYLTLLLHTIVRYRFLWSMFLCLYLFTENVDRRHQNHLKKYIFLYYNILISSFLQDVVERRDKLVRWGWRTGIQKENEKRKKKWNPKHKFIKLCRHGCCWQWLWVNSQYRCEL